MATQDGSKEAFPALQSVSRFPDGTRTIAMGAPGMTLREWYAGRAMEAMVGREGISGDEEYLARCAVDWLRAADALLAALEKTP